MSWNNCRKCVFISRSTFTSALFKVLVTLKLLHGSRTGAKGSTLEDIAMYMIKHYSLDGDIKSQVLATLKYGVKMHFIQKKKEKFSLLMPASSIHLAPCKFKNEEMERIGCIFPPTWYSNSCNDGSCNASGSNSCCGKRKGGMTRPCCNKEQEEETNENSCNTCNLKRKRSKSVCGGSTCSQSSAPSTSCSQCFPSKPAKQSCSECSQSAKKSKRLQPPCPKPKPSACQRRGKKKGSGKASLWDDYCQMCGKDDEEDACQPKFNFDAPKNCSCCDQ